MTKSADFKALVDSPLIGRAEAGKAIRALTPTLGLDPITANFLGVLADNGRLARAARPSSRLFRRLAADASRRDHSRSDLRLSARTTTRSPSSRPI